MKKRKKILIVGGTGFIGFHLVFQLTKKNYSVSSLSTKLPIKERKIPKVNYLICDICKFNQLKKVLKNKNFDYVVNLGGYVDHSNKKKTYESHFTGCKNLTKIFLQKKINRFIQIGSSIENGGKKSPQTESSLTKESLIKSVYGLAKYRASQHLIDLHKKFNFPAVILRLYLVYGPKQDTNRFLPIIIKNCLNNKSFPCSTGKQFRDFLYIQDLIDLIKKFLNIKTSLNGEIFNIGSGKPRNIKKTIQLIIKQVKGGRPLYGKIKLRKDEIIKLYPNLKKIKKHINWKPKVSFKLGLKKSINYYEKLT